MRGLKMENRQIDRVEDFLKYVAIQMDLRIGYAFEPLNTLSKRGLYCCAKYHFDVVVILPQS
jgi:hypothetical protein